MRRARSRPTWRASAPSTRAGLERFFDIGRTRVEPFGVAGRDAHVEALFDDERYVALWPYQELWNQAKRLRAGARTPYGAVVAIETWLRSTGGFTYDESPPATGGLPPLAHFVSEGKRGYCQHFAGAMALMLRFLGIPARVAGGFTSGKREGDSVGRDRSQRPRLGRGVVPRLRLARVRPDAGAGVADRELQRLVDGIQRRRRRLRVRRAGRVEARKAARASSSVCCRRSGWPNGRARAGPTRTTAVRRSFWLLLLVGLAAGGAIGAAKVIRRRLRYLTRDPRRLAGAARRELADFLVDQGVDVRPSATPDELRLLVREELGADGRQFAAALAEARFGPPETSAAAAARAHKELRALLRVIRRGLGRTARLRGLVALRSLRA